MVFRDAHLGIHPFPGNVNTPKTVKLAPLQVKIVPKFNRLAYLDVPIKRNCFSFKSFCQKAFFQLFFVEAII
jgi:hypothetical protein